jgi:hypothetical protein
MRVIRRMAAKRGVIPDDGPRFARCLSVANELRD